MTDLKQSPDGASARPPEPPLGSLQGPRYRSGAVARMAGVPVSTLRIWERRYQVAAPPLTASGHRLYSAHDVQRLALMKRLIGLGHAIGTIAGLDLAALEQLAAARADAASFAVLPARTARTTGRMSVAVIGNALAQRLSAAVSAAPTAPAAVGEPRGAALAARFKVVAVSADLLAAEAGAHGLSADLLLVQLSTLHTESADRVLALARRLASRQVIVLYAFGPDRAVQTLRAAGAVARREPVSSHDLAALLAAGHASRDPAPTAPAMAMAQKLANASVAPRRFSDEALVQIGAMATTVACECPRHVAELVAQLASFETYCAECLNTGPDDAVLHADLNRVAASARAMFEAALVRVAQAEGFELPS